MVSYTILKERQQAATIVFFHANFMTSTEGLLESLYSSFHGTDDLE